MTSEAAAKMDAMYRLQRHVYDFTRKPYLLGRHAMLEALDARPGSSVLEIGCGTGRNLILAARKYPGAQLFGLDVSAQMLATAQFSVGRSGLASRIRLGQADATAFDPAAVFGRKQFDRIFISYSLSMIPVWEAVLRQALALLASGGSLHIVDFGDQAGLPIWFRAGLRQWLALFDVHPRTGLVPFVMFLTAESDMTATVERPLRGYAIRIVLRRCD